MATIKLIDQSKLKNLLKKSKFVRKSQNKSAVSTESASNNLQTVNEEAIVNGLQTIQLDVKPNEPKPFKMLSGNQTFQFNFLKE